MWGKPTKKFWKELPELFKTETIPFADKIIYGHFFIGNCDWYIAEGCEYSGKLFGFVNLGDPINAEWGYIDLDELKKLKVKGFEVEWDRHWKKQKFFDIWPKN